MRETGGKKSHFGFCENSVSLAVRAIKLPVFLAICLVACLAICLAGCQETGPEIDSIYPRIGRMGDVLTINGRGFGSEKNESFITIAGTSPTSSSYLSWDDEEISVRIPEFGEAGLVYVHRGRKKSNPALFANQLTLPVAMEGSYTGTGPRISSIEPPSGPIGSLITIMGSNFGSSREQSGVFFSWDAEFLPGVPIENRVPDFVEAFEAEFDYELWSEREIQVRIPDGAVSGNLEVRTPKGNSQAVYFEITGKPGTKAFRDKKSYALSYTVDLQIEKASLPNTLYIWMPQPALSASQRNVRLLSRSQEPFVENFQGSSLFQFIDTNPRTNFNISLSYVADVYVIETSIRSLTQVRLNKPSLLGAIYILPSPLVPSDDPRIKSQTGEIIGRESLPYPKAQKIYEWLISYLRVEDDSYYGGALEALEEKRADSFRASLLFCSLARAAGIPAQPVAGVLVNRRMAAIRHYWAEFWLDGFGWIPVDPALGAGLPLEDFIQREDHRSYYFGSLDNQRVTFSRGEPLIFRMTPWGRVTQFSRKYSLQNLWEEAVEGLESYSSLWSDVTITGIY